MKKFGFISFAAAIGICVFTGCGSKEVEKTTVITNTVTNFVTVPEHYSAEDDKFIEIGKDVSAAFTNLISDAQVLYRIGNVKMDYQLDDYITKIVAKDQVKAKFELVLRRNNIPIATTDDKQFAVLRVTVNGFLNQTDILCYSTRFRTIEWQPVYRLGEWRYAPVTAWDKCGIIATVGKSLASDDILNQIEKAAEVFANDYLAANAKK